MINPGGIPQIPGDIDALAQHASSLTGVGDAFATTGQQVNATWQGLSGVYRAPEVGEMLSATAPVQAVSASVGSDIRTVGGALTTYATEVKAIKARLAQLKTEAETFVSSVEGDDDWREDEGKVDKNNNLINAVGDEIAKFFEAQRRCANTINALYGGKQYTAVTGDQPKDGEYGYTADQLRAATEAGAELPWGKAEEHDGGFWGGVGNFFVGIGEGFMDMVKGLGGLIGWGENGWSWSNAGHAWAGLGKFALALGVYGIPVVGPAVDQTVGVPGFKRGEMGDTLLAAGKGLIAWDDWSKDPARAGGKATFNIVTAIVGTKGAGAGMRGVGAAAEGSRIAAVARTGTLMVRAGEAIGKLPTVSDLAISAGRKFTGLFDSIKGALHLDTPKIDVPHVNEPTPHPRPTDHTPQPRPGSVGDNLDKDPSIPDRPTAHEPSVPDKPPVREPAEIGSGNGHGNGGGDSGGGHSGGHSGDNGGTGGGHGDSSSGGDSGDHGGGGNGGGGGNNNPVTGGGPYDGAQPRPELTPNDRSVLDQHRQDLRAANPDRYDELLNDPDHKGKPPNDQSRDEALTGMDMERRGTLPEGFTRPDRSGEGEFLWTDPKTGKNTYYDVKTYRDFDPADPSAPPKPGMGVTVKAVEKMLTRQIDWAGRTVVLDTRYLNQSSIDLLRQVANSKPNWTNNVIWYP